jgi:hypothetical protein
MTRKALVRYKSCKICKMQFRLSAKRSEVAHLAISRNNVCCAFSPSFVPLELKHCARAPLSVCTVTATREPPTIASVIFVDRRVHGGGERKCIISELRVFRATGFDSERASWYFRSWRAYQDAVLPD